MSNYELNNLKRELIKIQINCLTVLSAKLNSNSSISHIDVIVNKADEIEKKINEFVSSPQKKYSLKREKLLILN